MECYAGLVMPGDYRTYCGGVHSTSEQATCEKSRTEAKQITRLSSRVAADKYTNITRDCEVSSLFVGSLIQATFQLLSRQVPTCDSNNSWWLHSAVSLGNQTTNNVTLYFMRS